MSITLPQLPPPTSGDLDFRFTVPQVQAAPRPVEDRRLDAPWLGITAGWIAGAADAVV